MVIPPVGRILIPYLSSNSPVSPVIIFNIYGSIKGPRSSSSLKLFSNYFFSIFVIYSKGVISSNVSSSCFIGIGYLRGVEPLIVDCDGSLISVSVSVEASLVEALIGDSKSS